MLYWEGWHQLSLLGQGLIHVSRGPYVGHMGKKVSQELFEILSKGTTWENHGATLLRRIKGPLGEK